MQERCKSTDSPSVFRTRRSVKRTNASDDKSLTRCPSLSNTHEVIGLFERLFLPRVDYVQSNLHLHARVICRAPAGLIPILASSGRTQSIWSGLVDHWDYSQRMAMIFRRLRRFFNARGVPCRRSTRMVGCHIWGR